MNMRTLILVTLAGLLVSGNGSAKNATASPSGEEGQPVATTTEGFRSRSYTFEQLGAKKSLPLRGSQSSVEIGFGVRDDELVTEARLVIEYAYSPSMIDRISHIKVYLNDEVIGTLPITRANAGKHLRHSLAIDPILIADYNDLRLQLIGSYVLDHCEDPRHSTLWADISGRSLVELKVKPLPLVDELGLLPLPFFDEHDSSRLILPVVFPSSPSTGTLEAAATITSWFGAQAAWRGARFPVLLGERPKRHAVVFTTNDRIPAFLGNLRPVEGPVLEMISLPLPPYRADDDRLARPVDARVKLLLVRGRNDADLKRAAQALALGKALLSGQRVKVERVDLGPPRRPYDAPNWVRLDRPVRLGELVPSRRDLQVAGHYPEVIRVGMRIPADLFTWRSRGVPVDLKYRYSPMIDVEDSRLNVSVNKEFVQGFTLRSSGRGGVKKRVRVPLLDEGLFGAGNEFFIPAFKLGANNELQFAFSFGYEKQDVCRRGATDNVFAAIDPDSTIDFTGFPHYATLPNLGFFANSGFPFTKYADLAQTTVILRSRPDRQELEAFLTLMGLMGQSTGYPSLRVDVATPDSLPLDADRDLLIIGSVAHRKMLERWKTALPATMAQGTRQLDLPARAVNLVYDWLGFDTKPDPEVATRLVLGGQGPLAGMIGFESPQMPGRSVLSLLATSSAHLAALIDALEDPAKVSLMHGSVVIVRPQGIESLLVGKTYSVGRLPLWTQIWYVLSRHPLLLASMAILAVALATLFLWRLLHAVRVRRTHGTEV